MFVYGKGTAPENTMDAWPIEHAHARATRTVFDDEVPACVQGDAQLRVVLVAALGADLARASARSALQAGRNARRTRWHGEENTSDSRS